MVLKTTSVGTGYIQLENDFSWDAQKSPQKIRAYCADPGNREEYGLKEDETIIGGIIPGYAESGEPERTPLERKGNPVIWVE